jgi:hypothetical protein
MATPLKRPIMPVDENDIAPPAKRQLSSSLAALRISSQGCGDGREDGRNSPAHLVNDRQGFILPSPFGGAGHVATASPFMFSSPNAVDWSAHLPRAGPFGPFHAGPHASQADEVPGLHMDRSFSSDLDTPENGRRGDDVLVPVEALSGDETASESTEDLSRALVVYTPPGLPGLKTLSSTPVIPRPMRRVHAQVRKVIDEPDNEAWLVRHTPDCVKRRLALVPYTGTRKRLFLPSNVSPGTMEFAENDVLGDRDDKPGSNQDVMDIQ